MPLPHPEPGLVISYAYLWHDEHRAGREEGVKDRPCVIVLNVERPEDGAIMVTVVPITHRPPRLSFLALEIPRPVKRHLGLDDASSWVVLDEGNEFAWPGFDLRPVPGTTDRFDYGLLPPKLFLRLIARLTTIWEAGRRNIAPRE